MANLRCDWTLKKAGLTVKCDQPGVRCLINDAVIMTLCVACRKQVETLGCRVHELIPDPTVIHSLRVEHA